MMKQYTFARPLTIILCIFLLVHPNIYGALTEELASPATVDQALMVNPEIQQSQLTPDTAPQEAQIVITEKENTENTLPFPAKRNKKKKIEFQYQNEDIVNIINYLASQMGINIMLPQGADAINAKLTLSLPKKIPLSEAWQLLHTVLDAAGYNIEPKADLFMIKKSTKDIYKETLGTYIGISPELLPAGDETIRYLYYLSNIRITKDADDEIKTALKAILPPTALVEVDTNANALLIIDKSQNIRAAMGIVMQLDQPGFLEKMEMIRLRHTDSSTVAQLFTDQVLKATAQEPNRYRLDAQKTSKEATYFSSYTKVIAVPRLNSLLLLGRAQAIDRIKDFIFRYIDVELESGRSILHVYQLQYLDADKMVEVLNQIVDSAGPGGAEQAKAAAGTRGGAERFFAEKIYIKSDGPAAGVSESEKKYFGSNRLVIAARYDDWLELQKLIEQLDQPQPQVLLETLIADLTVDDVRQLGTFVRNPENIPLPSQVEFESAQLPPSGMTNSWIAPTTLDADLLRKAIAIDPNTGSYTKTDVGPNSIAAIQNPPGGITIEVNDSDGSTWGLARILKNLNITKILTMPHIIATHNKKASIQNTDIRIVKGPVTGTDTAEVKYVPLPASLKIELTPRIISDQELNLDIGITIQEFLSGFNNRATRTVQTLARVGNENVLAIGGLIRSSSAQTVNSTPVLSKIPIIGWLFKNNVDEEIQTNLTVFIKPTIIMPRFRAPLNSYTKDYIRLAKGYSDEGALFDALHDPITRWFFNTAVDTQAEIREFLQKDEILKESLLQEREEILATNNANQQIAIIDKEKISAQLKKQLQSEGNFEELIKQPEKNTIAEHAKPAPIPMPVFDKKQDAKKIKALIGG